MNSHDMPHAHGPRDDEHPDIGGHPFVVDVTPDPLLGSALRALDRQPPIDMVRLRQRVLESAAPRLAARRVPSWWEVTSRAGRFLIPASLAAAALAIVLLREAPAPADSLDAFAVQMMELTDSSSLAYDFIGDGIDSIAAEALLPTDADSWLLGDHSQ
jgi:hypothetical protein